MVFLRYVFLLIVLLPTVTLAEQNKFDAKVAVVDVESILEHSLAIKYIKKTINDISAQIQSDLTQKEIELKRIEADLIKKRGTLSEIEFNKKVFDFNKLVNKAQQETQNKKAALEHAHTEAIAEVHKNTIAVISELAKKYDFNIVFPSSQVFFVESNMNITLEVINNLNERLTEVEVKYNPAASNK
ncbi:MAG: hypothetical protein Tsb006_7100 [Rickettsiaceae bacterium]